ncbi:DUF1501 domain-containing protein [Rhodocytophaga rosea]|uniref:DUF1501 domain-containing protein n=1 Tax=Rhodocytophaga rosea TaxID=2704465 RepID=A0A6C0GFF0_9BACT|nr:DUF1501 domain-containing protein [Rhodocytophaga rosea]QHT66751.1 DUF1501 domain-containing protein [Rhodocytophaga rosea]
MSVEILKSALNMNRRTFLSRASIGVGSLALGSLLVPDLFSGKPDEDQLPAGVSHFAPKAKRVIYLFQSGAPSQLELFDHKPLLRKMHGQELPASIRMGQRLTGMTAFQKSFPLIGSFADFAQHGQSGAWLGELLPFTSKVVDDICIIRSMHTEAINHDPAVTFFQTGNQQPGRPSMGSWLSYGLGSENKNLPAFCVLLSRGQGDIQPLASRIWGNGFLDSIHQGVQLRSGHEPVLYLQNPDGTDSLSRRKMLDHLATLNHMQEEEFGDPEITARISQYEMAYRMQTSVPEVTDFSDEPESSFKLYGADSMQPGTFAANCLLARRLSERGVRFVQLYHMGWDAHTDLPGTTRRFAKNVDQASAALIQDLKNRGMLDETLVIWGGEFGRTNYCQGTYKPDDYGRDHHPRCFTIWMAGGGIKPGITYGETDEFGYNIIKDPVHVHDFQATILHLFGYDHEKLIFKHQGRRYRLTDVSGHVVKGILA